MNRIYSKVWNQSTGQVSVASELAKAKGKGKGGRLLQAAVVAGALALAGAAIAQGPGHGHGQPGKAPRHAGKGQPPAKVDAKAEVCGSAGPYCFHPGRSGGSSN